MVPDSEEERKPGSPAADRVVAGERRDRRRRIGCRPRWNVSCRDASKAWYESTVEIWQNQHRSGPRSRLSLKPEGTMKRVLLALCAIALIACPGTFANAQKVKKNPEPQWDPKTVKTLKVVVMGVTASRQGE